MLPGLAPGDLVLADPTVLEREQVQIGDIVIAQHPFKAGVQLVKRVAAIEASHVRLSGDNPKESTDSAGLGLFPSADLLGKVLVRAR